MKDTFEHLAFAIVGAVITLSMLYLFENEDRLTGLLRKEDVEDTTPSLPPAEPLSPKQILAPECGELKQELKIQRSILNKVSRRVDVLYSRPPTKIIERPAAKSAPSLNQDMFEDNRWEQEFLDGR